MAWLINEDEAMKSLLTGITVTDQNATRKVKVWFRYPEAEERELTYPFITIDMIDINEAEDLAHRGRIEPGYLPEGYAAPPVGHDYKTEFPVPVTLVYQVTSHTRSAWHDRQLTTALHNIFPFRFGSLFVPADNTVRTMQLAEFMPADRIDANSKRVFIKAYTVTVASEIFPSALLAVPYPSSVVINVDYQPDHPSEAPVVA